MFKDNDIQTAAFNVRTGKPGSLPATRAVPSYEVRVEAGVVYVELEPQEEQ